MTVIAFEPHLTARRRARGAWAGLDGRSYAPEDMAAALILLWCLPMTMTFAIAGGFARSAAGSDATAADPRPGPVRRSAGSQVLPFVARPR